jgi:hypothetical protein
MYDVRVTPEALQAAAQWAEPEMAAVELLVDDRMLIVSQGDERAAFDTGGELASDEYLAVAPLDRGERATDDQFKAIREAASALEEAWEGGDLAEAVSNLLAVIPEEEA